MKVGKQTYIKKAREILESWGYKETDKKPLSVGASSVSIAYSVNPLMVVEVHYEPYEEHLLKINISGNVNIPDVFNDIIVRQWNIAEVIPQREFKDKSLFENSIMNIFDIAKNKIEKIENDCIDKFKLLVTLKSEDINNVLDNDLGRSFLESVKLSEQNIIDLYELTGNDIFLPSEAKDIFLF